MVTPFERIRENGCKGQPPAADTNIHIGCNLWEGRYKSSAVQAEANLFACMRYIELNPVRAGMVSDPAHYRWSRVPLGSVSN